MQILKRMKNQKAPLLDLLDLILEQAPAPAYGLAVEMGCPRHPGSHLIRFEDFQLLEKIEGALGTAEQMVRSVNVGWMEEPALSLLSARLSRQQEKVAAFHAWRIMISSMEGAEAWKTIMEACEEYKPIGCVQVLRGIGIEGWEALAKFLQLVWSAGLSPKKTPWTRPRGTEGSPEGHLGCNFGIFPAGR